MDKLMSIDEQVEALLAQFESWGRKDMDKVRAVVGKLKESDKKILVSLDENTKILIGRSHGFKGMLDFCLRYVRKQIRKEERLARDKGRIEKLFNSSN